MPFTVQSVLRLAALSLTLLLALACPLAQAGAPSARPALEHFFSNARFSQPAFSPDGKMLAVIVGAPGKRDALGVIDLDTNKVHATASFKDADIANFQWVNDKRLMYSVRDRELAQGDMVYGPGLYAVNVDGSGMRQLAERSWRAAASRPLAASRMLPPRVAMLAQPGRQDSDTVHITHTEIGSDGSEHVRLLALDTLTGRAKYIAGPGETIAWMLDYQGEPRIAVARDEARLTVHLRRPDGAWKPLTSFQAFTGGKNMFRPLAYGAGDTLYVLAHQGRNTSAVHTYNISTGEISKQALIETSGYDFDGSLVMSNGVPLGFHYVTDAPGSYWMDAHMKSLQAEIDAALGGTINIISRPRRGNSPWVLVSRHSDVQPTSVLLYHTRSKTFTPVGSTHPDIKPEQMGRQQALSYQARDGLTIPALLTLPAGQDKNLPMVVLVHGGPHVRGSVWGWAPTAQFLASRGYAVLEPAFRGTTGLGAAHFRAGWRQWGLAMQDDLADGARWAIEQGIADGKRICIAGSSYGGYATLMGLIKDPDLFKCGINWVGVTDLTMLNKGYWGVQNDASGHYRKYGFPELIGDVIKDAEQFKATSPLLQAARIKQPLLLAYGGAERRVPHYHGSVFYDKVRQTNGAVEWVSYPNEGHGFALAETRIDFFSRVEQFLDRHIGPGR